MKKKTIYLTDRVDGKPDVKPLSKEILFSIGDFYRRPHKADGYRKNFSSQHKLAEDSGGFQVLMGRITIEEVLEQQLWLKTVDIYKRIGVTHKDFPIQFDLPPKFGLSIKETEFHIRKSAEIYHIMTSHIPYVLPVIHGWTAEQLLKSYELIMDSDKLAVGSNMATHARTKNVMSGKKKSIATPGGDVSTYVVGHLKSVKTKQIATGAFMATSGGWTMGHLNSHSSIRDRLAVGAFMQSGDFVCDSVANTPRRMKRKALTVGANLQSGQYVLDDVKSTPKKVVASPACTAETIQNTIMKANKRPAKKKHRAPVDVVLQRLATVVNLFRNHELFVLGGASSHFQHMIFQAGGKYTDTSSWRLKAYMGGIFLPEIGARSIGYKDTDKRLQENEIPILRECLRDPTHPANQMGFSVREFLELGHMNVKGYYETVKAKKWACKPFPLRALHNAWVLKFREEPLANEYSADPDRYREYLLKRFEGRRELMRRFKKLQSMLKRNYVQYGLQVFLKRRTREPNMDKWLR